MVLYDQAFHGMKEFENMIHTYVLTVHSLSSLTYCICIESIHILSSLEWTQKFDIIMLSHPSIIIKLPSFTILSGVFGLVLMFSSSSIDILRNNYIVV